MNIPKFRAWDKVNKKMLEVNVIDFNFEKIRIINDNGHCISVDFKNIELMQSTGLEGKNNKEIYEGDIIEVNVYGEIIIADVKHGEYDYSADDEYECHRYGWYINHVWKRYLRNTGYCLNAYKGGCEVIGNIYENPELLKEGVR